MGFFSKLFGKKEKPKSGRSLAEAFHATKDDDLPSLTELVHRRDKKVAEIMSDRKRGDIMVNTDLAFQEPAYKRIKEIESKIQVTPEDFKDISFELDLENFSFGDISDEAKQQIIEIVRNDRLNKLKKAVEDE